MPAAPLAQSHNHARRVLVVNNSPYGADALSDLIQRWGYDARCAYDGEAALEMAREYLPHVVLLDIGMAGRDGYQVAARLREESGGEPPVLVAMTGYGRDADRERAQAADFQQHLTKPVDPDEVERLLGKICFPDAGREHPREAERAW